MYIITSDLILEPGWCSSLSGVRGRMYPLVISVDPLYHSRAVRHFNSVTSCLQPSNYVLRKIVLNADFIREELMMEAWVGNGLIQGLANIQHI